MAHHIAAFNKRNGPIYESCLFSLLAETICKSRFMIWGSVSAVDFIQLLSPIALLLSQLCVSDWKHNSYFFVPSILFAFFAAKGRRSDSNPVPLQWEQSICSTNSASGQPGFTILKPIHRFNWLISVTWVNNSTPAFGLLVSWAARVVKARKAASIKTKRSVRM